MVELPVIRENPKQLVYEIRNRGSVTLPEEARKAHRVLVDIEIISVTRTQYQNLQYNLPQGDYCNVTYWAGASISQTRKVKYPSERLLDWVNIEAGIVYQLGITGAGIIQAIINLANAMGYANVNVPPREPQVWGLPISHLKFVAPPDTQFRITIQWYPFVDAPNVAEPNPDLDDPAEGEDEYPSPRRNPASDPWEGNNVASPLPADRDIRDAVLEGSDTSGYYTRAIVTFTGYTNPQVHRDSVVLVEDVGLFEGIIDASEFAYVCRREATTQAAGTFCNLWDIRYKGNTVKSIEVSLVDAPVVTVTIIPPIS